MTCTHGKLHSDICVDCGAIPVSAERDAEKARADAAEQMVVELRAAGEKARRELAEMDRHLATRLDSDAVTALLALETALSRTEAVAGRWVERKRYDTLFSVAQVEAAERDAAIAARDEAVASLDVYEQRIREIADDVFGLQDASGASVVLLDAIGRQCHRERIERTAAERARDEVGIQLAAAQVEIARLRRVVDETRTVLATPACERLPAERAVCDAIRALDAVPGDALAPRITAALEAIGIDTDNVKGVE